MTSLIPVSSADPTAPSTAAAGAISSLSRLLNETLVSTTAAALSAAMSTAAGPSMASPNSGMTGPPPTPSASIYSLRMALTITHLLLVSIGSINLLVIFVILSKPYMRSITNVYMISLCLADFMYLANLTLVAATQLNDRSWIFGSTMCTIYHGTETTGKYASVLFVVLLAADRYCAMCKANWCSRYRTYRVAITLSLVAWGLSILAATPLYAFSEVVMLRYRFVDKVQKLCIAKWPSSEAAKWYITFSSVLIFAVPLVCIIFCYYHILNKLREALKGSKRLRRGASSRAPYQRVTRLVLWVVVFHVICWSPFWLFNVFSSVFGLRIQTQFDRIVINVLHLLPYFNCALNPLLYAAHAENFRQAIKSIFTCGAARKPPDVEDSRVYGKTTIKPQKSTYNRMSFQSSDRLMSPNMQGHPDLLADPTVKFKRSTALSDIVPSYRANLHVSINDSASMCGVITDRSLLMSSKTSSQSYDNIDVDKGSNGRILSDIVSRWKTTYKPNLTVNKCNDLFIRQQSSGALIADPEPMHHLASLNSVAINFEDTHEMPDTDSPRASPVFRLDDAFDDRELMRPKMSVPSFANGDVFI